MEEWNLEEAIAEFKNDSDMVKLINTVQNAREDYETIKRKNEQEQVKVQDAEELLKIKQKELTATKLSRELSKLHRETENELTAYNAVKEKREKVERKISRIDKSMLPNFYIILTSVSHKYH